MCYWQEWHKNCPGKSLSFMILVPKERVLQVTAEEIVSDDVFILSSPDGVVIWSGEDREDMELETNQAERYKIFFFIKKVCF